ncbi:MAG: hypothetical protein EOM01_14490 [Spirochaetia bacterium]|nr:hypothetical protein [Spirochaetia bacterium]
MSHTPGPWDIYGSEIVQGPLGWDEDGSFVGEKPVSSIASVWKYPPKRESPRKGVLSKEEKKAASKDISLGVEAQKANLFLVAAAPDMLAMLEELQECAYYWSEYDVPLGIKDRLDETIRKARGED